MVCVRQTIAPVSSLNAVTPWTESPSQSLTNEIMPNAAHKFDSVSKWWEPSRLSSLPSSPTPVLARVRIASVANSSYEVLVDGNILLYLVGAYNIAPRKHDGFILKQTLYLAALVSTWRHFQSSDRSSTNEVSGDDEPC